MIAVITHSLPPLGASTFAPSAQTLFLALNLAWAGCEIWLSVRRRALDNEGRDAGTLGLLWRVLGLAIAAAVCISISGYGHLPAEWLVPARWMGCVLIATGLVLRVWSIRVLARFFTVDVKVHADHELIQRGPYRWVRHPSYTGALLAFLGLGVGLGNVLALVVLVVPVLWAFRRRMEVEEAALREAFPVAYPVYAQRTGRLLPRFFV
ncbi:MAG TPA: isoprenylcysteine carboxylmethyltransferase family protein [Stenotrophomonas sp.]|nr:isoprenylcysteine carboxylmethyltransferase family protein [Stenotrophomonas sp.]